MDWLLQTRFKRPQGLADENTFILDPAVGTATFLYFVLALIFSKFSRQRGQWDSYVEKHLLNRLFGFEILMAPYAISHLKLGMELEETGYTFGSDQRLGIFLTNTLEESARRSERLFADWISEEANAAANIKAQLPIMVVLGNPPYANFGRMNRNPWILGLLDDYKRGLNEKKLNLDDDFIKFFRFAQWRIEKTGYGILGYITNHSYLEGITHRRMRESLMRAFDEIYVLDLHGSSKKKEKAPDGGKDENVFDITVGVSIILAVKLAKTGVANSRSELSRVFHCELWGERKNKYEWLWQNEVQTTPWAKLKPAEPYFFFVPKEFHFQKEYERYFAVNKIFSIGTSAVQTKRDALFVDFDGDQLAFRMRELLESGPTQRMADKYPIAVSPGWNAECLKKAKFNGTMVRPYLYRPFDFRFIYYDDSLLGRSRHTVFRHMDRHNFGFATLRQTVESEFRHVFCTKAVCDINLLISHHVSDRVFPLYLYPSADELDASPGGRPNINPEFLKALAKNLNIPQAAPHGLPKGVMAEDIFHYAYAVFHSPTYRRRYAEFLKIDFPRLPLTSNRNLFFRLAALGGELASLHLMEAPKLDNLMTEFPVKGTNSVDKVQYADKHNRVWINPSQYFAGVAKTAWEFHIGGYQVCEKWLKDRKGRKLTYEETQHYQKIVVALSETIRLMAEIDKVIETQGGWPGAFSENKT